MPLQLPGMCIICGEPALLTGEYCWFCAELRRQGNPSPARLAPPRSEPAWLPPGQTIVECHPSSADRMSAAGYQLFRSKFDPDTGVLYAQVWVKVPADKGS